MEGKITCGRMYGRTSYSIVYTFLFYVKNNFNKKQQAENLDQNYFVIYQTTSLKIGLNMSLRKVRDLGAKIILKIRNVLG